LRFISQNQPNIPKPMPTMMGPNELYQEKHCTLVDKASTRVKALNRAHFCTFPLFPTYNFQAAPESLDSADNSQKTTSTVVRRVVLSKAWAKRNAGRVFLVKSLGNS
jgi:hypothetical protein